MFRALPFFVFKRRMKPKVDLYQILGVDRKAAPDDLKRAYKQLALKHHPVGVATWHLV